MSSQHAPLILFDVDGTLFTARDEIAQHAMVEALRLLTGARLSDDVMDELDHEARTARWLAREVIREHGLPRVDLAAWVRRVEEIYWAELRPEHSRRWEAPAGTAETLEQLRRDGFRLALVTGVPQRIARLRIDALGLRRFFPQGKGAFGCEVDERADLLRLALERSCTPPERAVEVGDTKRDIRCSRELGLRSIAVGFDNAPPTNGDEADGVVRSMPELLAAVRALSIAERENGGSWDETTREHGRRARAQTAIRTRLRPARPGSRPLG